MVTSAQIRAARGLLDWTVRDLATQADVHRNTVSRIESGGTAGSQGALLAIRKALEAAGVIFLDANGDGPGVRLQSGRA